MSLPITETMVLVRHGLITFCAVKYRIIISLRLIYTMTFRHDHKPLSVKLTDVCVQVGITQEPSYNVNYDWAKADIASLTKTFRNVYTWVLQYL